MNIKIALVDDDSTFTTYTKYLLWREKIDAVVINDAAGALDELRKRDDIDLYLLDYDLDSAQCDGFSLCQILVREKRKPVVMLTGDASNDTKLKCLYAGANQYVTKPFDTQDLVARIFAAHSAYRLQNPESAAANDAAHGGSEGKRHDHGFDVNRRESSIRFNGRTVMLTPREFDLFTELLANRNAAMSRDALSFVVYGREHDYMSRSMDALVTRLKKKLRVFSPQIALKTIRGFGFQLQTAEVGTANEQQVGAEHA